MSEVLAKKQKSGFLMKSRIKNSTTGGGTLPVDTTSSTDHWSNTPLFTDASYGIPALPSSIVEDPKTKIEELTTANSYGVFNEERRLVTSNAGILPSVDIDAYASTIYLTTVLAGFFGNKTTSAISGGFKHINTLTKTTGNEVLDYPGNEGILNTIFGQAYDGSGVGDAFILERAVPNSFTWTIPNTTQGEARYSKIKTNWVGNKLQTGGDITGAISTFDTDYIVNESKLATDGFKLNLTIGGGTQITNLCWRNFELVGNTNIESDCFTADGYANNYKRKAPELMANIDIIFNSSTYTLLKDYQDGTKVIFDFSNGNAATALNHVKIDCVYGILQGQPKIYEGDYVALRLKVKFYVPETGSHTITLTNTKAFDLTATV